MEWGTVGLNTVVELLNADFVLDNTLPRTSLGRLAGICEPSN